MSYGAVPGPALRHARYDEAANEVVNLTPAVVRRLVLVGEKQLWCREDERYYECAIFKDPRTGEIYGQCCEVEDETAADAGE